MPGRVRFWSVGPWHVKFEIKPKNQSWGRFGGGWNWVLGFQIGGSTAILNLLVASIRVSRISSAR